MVATDDQAYKQGNLHKIRCIIRFLPDTNVRTNVGFPRLRELKRTGQTGVSDAKKGGTRPQPAIETPNACMQLLLLLSHMYFYSLCSSPCSLCIVRLASVGRGALPQIEYQEEKQTKAERQESASKDIVYQIWANSPKCKYTGVLATSQNNRNLNQIIKADLKGVYSFTCSIRTVYTLLRHMPGNLDSHLYFHP